MKRAPRSRLHHDLYAKYHTLDSKIIDLLGECGSTSTAARRSGLSASSLSFSVRGTEVRMLGTSLVLGIEQVVHVYLQCSGQFLEGGGGAGFTTCFNVDELNAVYA